MSLDICYSANVKVPALTQNNKLYDHIKNNLKNGLIQLEGPSSGPILSFLVNVGETGILVMKIKDALEPMHEMDSPQEEDLNKTNNVSFSFRNTSLGNTFVHSRELFGANVRDIYIVFYKRETSNVVQFVRTTITYCDNETNTTHKSVVEAQAMPFIGKMETSEICSRVTLCPKTANALQKFLKQHKTKEKRTVRVSINETLGVIIFTIGEDSKTIDFKMSDQQDLENIQTAKVEDVGHVNGDSVSYVSLESLTAALGCCKIPGCLTPCFRLYSSDILEVIGARLKGCTLGDASISVILLKAEATEENNSTSIGNLDSISKNICENRGDKYPQPCKDEARSPSTSVEEERPLTPSPPHCLSRPPNPTPVKRRHADLKKKNHKKLRLSFTPLI
uniref:DNA replication protein n=1 Tax=Bovine herpesvirus 4 TaxID=10385 RepID=A0A0F6N512_BHV4|nr:DNA replication protein [Bovine gammaherpesvirus 4]QJC19178.1 DNA replication protein [Bovine gammaherpesvirus 4]WEM32520.1 DNA replication protein [Bovine gammaherpesvirus 4]